jgi:flagella basal body P-ring formation protein FlgA
LTKSTVRAINKYSIKMDPTSKLSKTRATKATIRQNTHMFLWRILLLLTSSLMFGAALAQNEVVIDTAERFLRSQVQNMPGKASITMGQVNTSRLPPCTTHEAFFPPGARIASKVYVGVRCLGPNTWSVLIPAQIAVTGNYASTTRPLVVGQIIQAGDLVTQTGDIFSLPTGTITNPGDAIGKVLKNSVGVGQALRENQLQTPFAIRQGQTVKVISKGPGFSVSAEGKAVNNATSGQVTQIRMESGQVISGVAKPDGTIEISN